MEQDRAQDRDERRISRVLTLHAHPIGAVLGLEHHALTVLPPVFGCRSAAFSPPPVGALCPTGGPLTPLCPQAIHYHTTDKDGRGLSEWRRRWDEANADRTGG